MKYFYVRGPVIKTGLSRFWKNGMEIILNLTKQFIKIVIFVNSIRSENKSEKIFISSTIRLKWEKSRFPLITHWAGSLVFFSWTADVEFRESGIFKLYLSFIKFFATKFTFWFVISLASCVTKISSLKTNLAIRPENAHRIIIIIIIKRINRNKLRTKSLCFFGKLLLS